MSLTLLVSQHAYTMQNGRFSRDGKNSVLAAVTWKSGSRWRRLWMTCFRSKFTASSGPIFAPIVNASLNHNDALQKPPNRKELSPHEGSFRFCLRAVQDFSASSFGSVMEAGRPQCPAATRPLRNEGCFENA